eukprot:m.49743 g.49743  ORF g.49743 m.49743 type:complete len:229 (-) comp13367_c0_seq3:493-1179(-)
MAEPKLTLDAVSQSQRDDLRGWNDPPSTLGSAEGLKKPKSRHYSNSSISSSTSLGNSTSSQPFPTTPMTAIPPLEGTVTTLMGTLTMPSATPATSDLDTVALSCSDLATKLENLLELFRQHPKATTKLVGDVKKRLRPLEDMLSSDRLSPEAALTLTHLIQGIEQKSNAIAKEAHRKLTMQHSHEVRHVCSSSCKLPIGFGILQHDSYPLLQIASSIIALNKLVQLLT